MSNEALEPISNPESMEKEPKYDALLVLGACMEWDPKKNEWTFPTWVPPEIYGPELVMGKARAIATAEIAKDASVVLVTGGPQEHPETKEKHSRAKELSRLIKEYGVGEEKVISMGKGGNTLKNAEDTADYLEKNPEVLKQKKIAILSPQFQQKRAKMMFDKHPYFKEHGIDVDWVIVEDVLEGRDPKYKEWTEALYQNPKYGKVLQSEIKGIRDLNSGEYTPKQ